MEGHDPYGAYCVAIVDDIVFRTLSLGLSLSKSNYDILFRYDSKISGYDNLKKSVLGYLIYAMRWGPA